MGDETHWDTVEGEFDTRLARVKVVRGSWDRPIDESGSAPTHHLELNLLPVPGGAGACFVDRWRPNRFEPLGDLFFLPAYRHVRFRSNCRQQNSVICDFSPDALENWFQSRLECSDSLLQQALNLTNDRIRTLLFRIVEEVRNPGFAAETMIELLVSQAAIELTRHMNGFEEERVAGGLASWRLKLVDQRLSDMTSQPSLTELAELCDLSVRQLTRAFRTSRGRSIGAYIAEKRTEHAKKLIASGMSIKSVAYTMGFSAPSNFTAAFSRITGETPRQYRLRVRCNRVGGQIRTAATH